MPRVGYLYLPDFLLKLVRSGQPQLAECPLLVYREGRVLAASPELQGRVVPGMTIGLAGGRCPEARAVEMPPGTADAARKRWLNALMTAAAAVEPVGEEEAFFIPAEFYGRSSAQSLRYLLRGWEGVIGIGGSKMAARLAAHSLLGSPRGKQGIKIREIKVGGEADFLQPCYLSQDPFLPLTVHNFFKSIGVSTFAEAQRLSQADLLSLLGEQAYRIYLHCRGRDNLPVIGSYPPQQITVGFSCPPEESPDTFQLQPWLQSGVKMLASKLQERNCGCRRIVLNLWSAGKQLSAERILIAGHQQAKSLECLFTMLADQMTSPEGIEQLIMQADDLYPLNYMEQDLFNPQVITSGSADITDLQEALSAKYPRALTPLAALDLREEAFAQFDPWRGAQSKLPGGENGVHSSAHP